MINSKVIDILKKFDRKELKELGDFVDSPFHNKNKNVIKLYYSLLPFYPGFENKKLSKEFIYGKIFPDKSYADKTFRNLMSDLLNLIESYLAYSYIDNDKYYRKFFRTVGLAAIQADSLEESSIKEADKLFSDFKFDGGNIFYLMHLMEMEKDFLAIRKNKLINLNMKEGEYLVYAFLSKYLIFKMKYYNYRYKLGTEKLSGFIEEFEKSIDIKSFIKYIELDPTPENEIILIYYYCTKFMSDISADSYYSKVKLLFEKNKSKLNRTETVNLYLTFNGYCVAKIRQGSKEYARELFSIYKKMFEENLAMGEGETHLHITIFYNVVSIALNIGENGWARSFIDKYHQKLLPEYKETMYNYSYSLYHFHRKEFEKSLERLNKVNFENHFIKTGVRILLLKIYYELMYTESFLSMCDSIKHYFAGEKQVPADIKISSVEFINIAGKLYRSMNDPSKEKLLNIQHELENKQLGLNKDWLLEKLGRIEKIAIPAFAFAVYFCFALLLFCFCFSLLPFYFCLFTSAYFTTTIFLTSE